MPNYLSADHIAAQAGNFEPQRKNNFLLTLVIPGGGGSEILQAALHKFPIPKVKNTVIRIEYGNEERKVAGPVEVTAETLEVKDFIDSPVMQTLVRWRNKVYDPQTGIINNVSAFKTTGTVSMLGPDGVVSQTWQLQGVWPEKITPASELSMESGENNLITVVLRVDRVVNA